MGANHMYLTVQSFISDYKNEAAVTQKLLDSLTDTSLKQGVAPGHRSLGDLAWHLVPASGMLEPMGLKIQGPPNSEHPAKAAEIAEQYRVSVQSLLEGVSEWDDEKMEETKEVFGFQWKNGMTLSLFVKHEIHHRGQLTVLMRQAGLPVTGAYGPSKEEWSDMGAPTS
jgi:uncharacterized damage-inducible protein DinB